MAVNLNSFIIAANRAETPSRILLDPRAPDEHIATKPFATGCFACLRNKLQNKRALNRMTIEAFTTAVRNHYKDDFISQYIQDALRTRHKAGSALSADAVLRLTLTTEAIAQDMRTHTRDTLKAQASFQCAQNLLTPGTPDNENMLRRFKYGDCAATLLKESPDTYWPRAKEALSRQLEAFMIDRDPLPEPDDIHERAWQVMSFSLTQSLTHEIFRKAAVAAANERLGKDRYDPGILSLRHPSTEALDALLRTAQQEKWPIYKVERHFHQIVTNMVRADSSPSPSSSTSPSDSTRPPSSTSRSASVGTSTPPSSPYGSPAQEEQSAAVGGTEDAAEGIAPTMDAPDAPAGAQATALDGTEAETGPAMDVPDAPTGAEQSAAMGGTEATAPITKTPPSSAASPLQRAAQEAIKTFPSSIWSDEVSLFMRMTTQNSAEMEAPLQTVQKMMREAGEYDFVEKTVQRCNARYLGISDQAESLTDWEVIGGDLPASTPGVIPDSGRGSWEDVHSPAAIAARRDYLRTIFGTTPEEAYERGKSAFPVLTALCGALHERSRSETADIDLQRQGLYMLAFFWGPLGNSENINLMTIPWFLNMSNKFLPDLLQKYVGFPLGGDGRYGIARNEESVYRQYNRLALEVAPQIAAFFLALQRGMDA